MASLNILAFGFYENICCFIRRLVYFKNKWFYVNSFLTGKLKSWIGFGKWIVYRLHVDQINNIWKFKFYTKENKRKISWRIYLNKLIKARNFIKGIVRI